MKTDTWVIHAKILEDDCSFCLVLNFRGFFFFFLRGLHDKCCQLKNKSYDHKMRLEAVIAELEGLVIATTHLDKDEVLIK